MCKQLTWKEKYLLCSKSYLSIEDVCGLLGCGRPKAKSIIENIKKSYSKKSASSQTLYKYKVPTGDALKVLGISEDYIYKNMVKEINLSNLN